ncbi:MAG TPA: GAF domain-containing protein [Anaerolineales bacterium]|nr:GAF domain-containing protein [Anaerolineales bacterium]
MNTDDHSRALLELLIGVSREVATALDLRTVLQRLLFAAIKNVGGERASIVVLDDMGKPIDATIVYGKRLHEHTTQQLRETVERGLAGWVVRHRKSVLVPDTSKDERWLRREDDAAERTGAKSAICVPLLARERLVGVLTLVHSVPNAFNEDHLELMQAIADQASVAVLNARLYTESQRTARVMSALAESAAAINTSLEMPDVWRRILNQTMQALQVETVALALMEPGGGMIYRAAAGQNSGNILDRRVPPGKGLIGYVVKEGRGLVVPNVELDKRYSDDDKFGGIEMRAVALAPIQSQGKILGVIEAINPIAKFFDPDALLVMTGLGSLAGTTIQNAMLFERLNQAHQRYRELFEDSIDSILITDWGGKILEANRQAVTLSGYPSEQLHALTIDQLHDVSWGKAGLDFELLREHDSTYESTLHRLDGGMVPVEVHTHRVEFEGIESIQWILRDITSRKDLDALRDDMTAMIYHDLRSPLANIISSLDMLQGMIPQDETNISMLNIALNSTARIQRLINSLLDINRLESGQQILEQKAVDPAALVDEAIKDVEPGASGRHQKIDIRLSPAMPLIFVDVDMIHRVFINLLENAIKFTPVEGHIEIGGRVDSAEWVKFWVRDTGPGIPPQEQERIFEKFVRLRRKEKVGGLGVGLAFCRLATQAHGGQIVVESEVGKGSTFWLTLPVARMVKKTGKLLRQTGRLQMQNEE